MKTAQPDQIQTAKPLGPLFGAALFLPSPGTWFYDGQGARSRPGRPAAARATPTPDRPDPTQNKSAPTIDNIGIRWDNVGVNNQQEKTS